MLKLCTWSATHWNETAFLGGENAVNHSFRSTCSKGCRKVSICVDGELSPVKSSLQVDMVQFRCHLAIVAAFVVAFVASAASHSSRLQVVWCGMATWFYLDAVASSPSLQLDSNGPKEGRPRPTRFQDFPNVLSNDFCWFLSTASSDGHWDTLCVCHSVEMVPEDDTDALEPGMAECWRAPWSNIESYQERVLDANEMRPLSPMKSGEVSPSMETNRLPNSNVQFIPRKATIFASVVVPSESCLTTLRSRNNLLAVPCADRPSCCIMIPQLANSRKKRNARTCAYCSFNKLPKSYTMSFPKSNRHSLTNVLPTDFWYFRCLLCYLWPSLTIFDHLLFSGPIWSNGMLRGIWWIAALAGQLSQGGRIRLLATHDQFLQSKLHLSTGGIVCRTFT